MPSERIEAEILSVLDGWQRLPTRRPDVELPFHVDVTPGSAFRVLLDTTVYVDELQQRLPVHLERLLVDAVVLHSAVARAELALSVAYLNPR